jgi:hypothetical protein
MKFQPGDLVAFLNEKQSGTVIKVLPGNKVLVAIEDGFEIPVSQNELVLTAKKEGSELKHNEEAPPEINLPEVVSICPPQTAMLVAVPAIKNAVLSGPVSYMLVNRSGSLLVFTFHIKTKDGWKGICGGNCTSESAFLLFEMPRTELSGISSMMIRILVFREQGWSHADYVRKEIAVLLPGIESSNSDKPGNLAFAKTIVLLTNEIPSEKNLNELVEKFSQEKKKIESKDPARTNTSKSTIREVDLHIEELVENLEGLTNSEMLRIQLQHFSKSMDAAITEKLHKIIFIHGVGNGTLKNAIRRELVNYRGITFHDADEGKYGYGATEVILMQL